MGLCFICVPSVASILRRHTKSPHLTPSRNQLAPGPLGLREDSGVVKMRVSGAGSGRDCHRLARHHLGSLGRSKMAIPKQVAISLVDRSCQLDKALRLRRSVTWQLADKPRI